jgi:5-methylcytosine-specific restriction protein A
MPRTYGHRWQRLRLQVLERDGWRCQIRGPKCLGEADEVDHIVPVLVDPYRELDPTNCRASCRPCNLDRRGGGTGLVNRSSREW